jgi:hypothetical protein
MLGLAAASWLVVVRHMNGMDMRSRPIGSFQLFVAVSASMMGAMMLPAAALWAIANVMPAPPLPFLPAEQHGRLVIFAVLVNAGEGEVGERAIAPFRALANPIADTLGPKSYPEIFMPGDEGVQPGTGSSPAS